MVNIKQLIKDKGISQVELSRLLNEHTSVVSLLVNGKRELTEAHLARLAEIFGEEVISQYDGLTDYEVAEKDVMVNIKGIITDFNLTQTDIAKIMGEPQSVVSTLANGKRKQTRQHIDALIAHFGQEVIDKYTLPSDAFEPKVRDAEIIEEAKELGREGVALSGDAVVIEDYTNGEGRLHCVTLPFVDKGIATAPDIDVRSMVLENREKLENFPFAKMVKGVSYVQTAITMAMAPRYLPGDFLFIGFNDKPVLSGKIYLVDTKLYGTMLREVYIEEGGYLLKATNPNFKDVFVKYEDVYSISKFILAVITNTSLATDINLAEMVKFRDAQVKEMSTTLSTSVSNVEKLLVELQRQGERMDDERKHSRELTNKLLNNL